MDGQRLCPSCQWTLELLHLLHPLNTRKYLLVSLLPVPLGVYPAAELLTRVVILHSALGGDAIPFSTEATAFCTPAGSAQGLRLPHVLTSACCVPFFFV